MSSDSKKFIKGVTSGYAYMGFNLLISLWLLPFVLKFLAKPEYGVFAITSDMLSWLYITSLGISPSFSVKGGQLIGKKDYTELTYVASTAFFAQLCCSSLIIILAIVASLNPGIVLGKSVDMDHIGLVILLLTLDYAIIFIMQPLNVLLIANKQVHIDNYLKFGSLFIRTSLTVIFLLCGFKLLALALSSLIATGIIACITWYRVYKTFPEVRIKLSNFRLNRLSFLLNQGFWLTIGGLSGLFIFRMDTFMISRFINLETVTSFVITAKLYSIAETFLQQLFNTSKPYFVQIYGRQDMPLLRSMYNVSFTVSFMLAFIVGLFIFLINKWFISVWIGPSFFLGDDINVLFCISFIVQAAGLPSRIMLSSTFYKSNLHAMSRLVEGLLKLSICLVFIPIFGINIITISSIITAILFSNIYLNFLAAKAIGSESMGKTAFILFLLPLVVILFTPALFWKLVLILSVSIVLILFVVRKLTPEKKIIQPIYQTIAGRFLKKSV